MKGLKHFKILFRYFKDNKLILSLYIIFTILKYFEPLANAFIWATAFQALATGDKTMFITYLIMWSGVIILAWVLVQLPTDLIYNKLEKKFMECVNKDLYSKVSNMPAVAFEDIGSGDL